jgi:hypothetical protein
MWKQLSFSKALKNKVIEVLIAWLIIIQGMELALWYYYSCLGLTFCSFMPVVGMKFKPFFSTGWTAHTAWCRSRTETCYLWKPGRINGWQSWTNAQGKEDISVHEVNVIVSSYIEGFMYTFYCVWYTTIIQYWKCTSGMHGEMKLL